MHTAIRFGGLRLAGAPASVLGDGCGEEADQRGRDDGADEREVCAFEVAAVREPRCVPWRRGARGRRCGPHRAVDRPVVSRDARRAVSEGAMNAVSANVAEKSDAAARLVRIDVIG